ncbi:hypothetical protein FMO003_31560 [Moritella sp. F3]|nr:hypothetical protein FMO001_10630 [Moritella sp. F1]GIC82876.1 hypothetical protein FMO003_31560 [Moritella sp. F3]
MSDVVNAKADRPNIPFFILTSKYELFTLWNGVYKNHAGSTSLNDNNYHKDLM